jgi:ABC-type multidrug transport system ATPase subunit
MQRQPTCIKAAVWNGKAISSARHGKSNGRTGSQETGKRDEARLFHPKIPLLRWHTARSNRGRMKLELDGVSKFFGKTRALDEVSEVFEPGRIVAILGLNGAGKSTLLHCLAGILSLGEGRFTFDGEPFSRERVDLRRRFAFLPDFPLYFRWMNGLQHIGMVLRLYGKDTPDAQERVLDLLRGFDLIPLAGAKLITLSRGQIYKMALVALMAANPELWLLDEPMASGMDALGFREFRARARAAANAGATILYTTQILSVAEQFSDEVIVLHQGRVRARGAASGLHASGELEQLLASLSEEK